ncbi:MAG: DUF748 domain-containing protein [Verrucomicrobiales bacterium]|nr:DUF748 domain-containing protein [Verrucomicrobiales bacterium]MCP5527143.1 DUF748 domain-containing protein [Verrucomicrobiales bacterium]
MSPNKRASNRRRWPRWLKWILALLTAVGLYALLGFLVAPAIVKSQLVKRLPGFTHREARVGKVEIDPFLLTLTIRKLELIEPTGDLFAAFDVFHADLELASLWQRRLLLRDVTVQVPYLSAALREDGTLDLLDLVPPSDTNAPPSEPPQALIQRLRILNGGLYFEDRSFTPVWHTRVQPFHLYVTNLSTLAGANATFRFEANNNAGQRVELAGEFGLFPSVTARGDVRLLAPNLSHFKGYVARASGLQLEAGKAGVLSTFAVALGNDGLAASITNTSVEVEGLAVRTEKDTEPLLTLESLRASAVAADLGRKDLAVGRLQTAGATARVVRRPDGTVNAQDVYLPAELAAAIREMTDWQVAVGETTVTNYAAAFQDEGIQPPALLGVDRLWLWLTNFSNAPEQALELQTGLRWAESGSATVGVEGHLIPPVFKGRAVWEGLDLSPLQAYLEPIAHLALQQGKAFGALELGVELEATNRPVGTVTGQLGVVDLDMIETPAKRNFLGWRRVQLSGIEATAYPHAARFDELRLEGLRTSLVRTTNGQINVLNLLKTQPGATANDAGAEPVPPAASATNAPAIPPVELKTLRFEDAALYAADEMIPGQFKTAIESFSGTVEGLSYPEIRELAIDLSGKISEPAPFSVQGTVLPDPTHLRADLTVECSSADLTQFTPYSARYAGYPIERGTTTTKVHYRVDGSQLEGENLVYLDQLTFGEKTDSPDAISLPVKLGVALMKDRNGRITLDVPVSGSLDDPEFKISRVVWSTVKNLLVKAATAPFKMLGSLFGGGGEQDLEFVEFEPGASRLGAVEEGKLGTLRKALFERPQLGLTLVPGADPETDKPALIRNKLEASLRELEAAARRAGGATNVETASLRLTTAEREQRLLQAYTNRFGIPEALLSKAGATNTAAAEVAVPAPEPALSVVPMAPGRPRFTKSGAGRLSELAAREPASEPVSVSSGPAAPTESSPVAEAGVPAAQATGTPPEAEAALAPMPTADEMEQALLQELEITDQDLVALREQRAAGVKEQLTEEGQVTADRLRVDLETEKAPSRRARVTFELE